MACFISWGVFSRWEADVKKSRVCVPFALLYLFYVFVVCSFVYDLRSLMISLGIVRPGYREGEGVAEISIYPIYTPLRQPRKKTK